MKARKPDGSRWFTPTTAEVMDRWLEQPELLDWLSRTVELNAVRCAGCGEIIDGSDLRHAPPCAFASSPRSLLHAALLD